MILTCPNCGTQYVVKDDAIPPEGRQVRCAACKHSWHQDPETMTAGAETAPAEAGVAQSPETAPRTDDQRPEDESVAEATLVDPRSGPEAEERAYEEAVLEGGADAPDDAPRAAIEAAEPQASSSAGEPATDQDWNEPPQAEAAPDMFSPFADSGEVEPRRRRPLLTILVVALIVIALAAAFWFVAPSDLKARFGLASDSASPLALVVTHKDRQPLESGNELLTITGRVINPTSTEQAVPPLQAQLLDARGKVVYSWTITPPARSLAAGASASFNSAEIIKAGGDELTISLGQPKA